MPGQTYITRWHVTCGVLSATYPQENIPELYYCSRSETEETLHIVIYKRYEFLSSLNFQVASFVVSPITSIIYLSSIVISFFDLYPLYFKRKRVLN